MPLKDISRASAEPIDLIMAQLHVKQDAGTDDLSLRACIAGARDFAQRTTQRQLVAARFQMILDGFPGPSLMGVPSGESFSLPGHAILLEPNPIIQIVSITYIDMGGTTQTMPIADYVADLSTEPARITPVYGKIWPINLPQIASVIITFDAGYAAPFTADATANTIAVRGWKTLVVNDTVRFTNSGGALPAPLQLNTDYFVQSVSAAGVYTLSATAGGAVIDITGTGTGTHFLGEIPDGFISWMLLRLGAKFDNRAEVSLHDRWEKLPFADGLLDQYRVWRI